MTKQEADFIGSMNMCDEISNEAYKKIMCHCEVEDQQPCEDCISRQAVLEKKELVELEDGQSFYCINPKDVETLPSVTPQPKVGEWIDKGYDIGNCWATCSECDGDARGYVKDTGWGHDYYFPKFCPHCGARMNGGGEDGKNSTN